MRTSVAQGFWVAVVVSLVASFCVAQGPSSAPAVKITAEAVSGKPFGAGRLLIELPRRGKDDLPRAGLEHQAALRLTERNGRALYTVFADNARSQRDEWIRQEISATNAATLPAEPDMKDGLVVHFLFTGAGPLELTVTDASGAEPVTYTARVVPDDSADSLLALRRAWLDGLARQMQHLGYQDAYPPVVENYLLSMMSRRLRLPAPEIHTRWFGSDAAHELLGLLLGTESIRLAMQKRMLLDGAESLEGATQPLPKAVAPPAVEIPAVGGKVAVERIALRVPAECFYIRCGSFPRFRWMREFLDQWGTRMRDSVSSRAVDYDIRAALERQLALRETALSRLLGEQVISDVAIVGADTFVREGAALGILFEAKNGPLLAMQLQNQRAEAARAPGVKESVVPIASRKVSLLQSPGNEVRSYYVADGNYHLVTTSEYVVRRFLETGEGKDSLGASAEFRYARSRMPLSRDDTVFVYLSDAFFRNILAPAYRVEMTRRMRSLAKIELVHLARLAAAAEGRRAETLADLLSADVLPPGFDRDVDGARIELRDGTPVDSLRGARGHFTPVPDMNVQAVTPSEAKAYQAFAEQYRQAWERMDPVMIALKHVEKTPDGNQRVMMDLYLTPYARRHYDFLEENLGRPDAMRLAAVPGDLLSVQIILGKELFGTPVPLPQSDLRGPLGKLAKRLFRPAHTVFAGVRDFAFPFRIRHGEIDADDAETLLSAARLYAGESPTLFLLGWVAGRGIWENLDEQGYGHDKENKLWVRLQGGYSLVSPRRDTLEEVSPGLKFESAERKAQIRLRIEDLSRTRLAGVLHAAGYLHTREISAGNVLLMQALVRELSVPPAEAKQVAERILGARMVCPLGGRYELPAGSTMWRSSAWTTQRMHDLSELPAAARYELLEWFRGLSLEFTIDPEQRSLSTHAELDLAPDKRD